MRLNFSVAFLSASGAVSSPLGVFASNSLSYDQLDSVIKTVATSGFDFSNSAIGPDSADATFSSTIDAQWKINAEQPDETAPYLVCETTPGISGYERSERIKTLCNRERFGQKVVQNIDYRTCFNEQFVPTAALACSTSDANISVVPYSSWNKISAASFTSSLRENLDVVESVRYAGYFCEEQPTDAKKKNRKVVKKALKQAFDDNTNCGSGTSFKDIFTLDAEESRILLHQIKRTPYLPKACMQSLVESLGSHSFVCDVEYDPPVTTFNRQARWVIQGSVYGNDGSMDLPLHQVGINGENQVAQMSDTGLSVNSCYFYDENGEVARDQSANIDSARRKVIQYYAKTTSEDENGHGTHCAGTILGKICTGASCSTSNNQDGTAPEAKIAVYDIGNSGRGLYPDYSNPMFVRGAAAGATVHSASWGNGLNYYQNRDIDYDRYQHQNDSFLVVFAAGNGGRNNRKNSSSSVAKNNLNVCASRNKNQGMGELYTAYFSSMGPSADGRIKPDICAPGHSISSANKGQTRQCGAVSKSGTSMAAPGVAGAALLVRQYFVDGFSPSGTKIPEDGFEPSGALVKAVILNSGRVMLGRDNGSSAFPSTEFDESQGFGLISLVDGLYLKDKSKRKVLVWDRVPLTSGQEWEEYFKIETCEAAHTSITLTYFDKENSSTSCNPCIVNRIDLTVEKDGFTHYPNGLSGPDKKNNSQRIRIPHVEGDLITVKVKATNLVTAEQKFALVVSGCLEDGTNAPTMTNHPSDAPTRTKSPSSIPTSVPSNAPTMTKMPSKIPSSAPSNIPSMTKSPSDAPTNGNANYVKIAKGCVNGKNIKLYKNKSVRECASICDNTPTCKGFEYGVAYGGRGRYVPGDCQPQSSSDTRNCNGGYHNLDFYKQV
uniref:subtilisin n=2 Tax=Corethron hystrix TaxID=216773 RepID=A0A7S1B9H0_9STRA|mmetsp:Transcript_18208/g.41480  ORF Transcript_18208/g.41480 Transcript_18208/m.41480 type:complete len:889 (+) Transcript_18208:291-2957(+)